MKIIFIFTLSLTIISLSSKKEGSTEIDMKAIKAAIKNKAPEIS
jgi:hypothetical protein